MSALDLAMVTEDNVPPALTFPRVSAKKGGYSSLPSHQDEIIDNISENNCATGDKGINLSK